MQIDKDMVVTVRYRIDDAQGRPIQNSGETMVYLHGGYDNILPKIESALQGKAVGYQVRLDLEPQDAFGERDERLVRTIPKTEFPPGIKLGGQLQGHNDDGTAQSFTVIKIKGPTVFLDGNHPLAGKALRFHLKVTDVRPASAEEIAHRHVHGAHGHQH